MIFFFFQAEDGIRDIGVTGVQTCALPISHLPPTPRPKQPFYPAKSLFLHPQKPTLTLPKHCFQAAKKPRSFPLISQSTDCQILTNIVKIAFLSPYRLSFTKSSAIGYGL